VGSLHDALDEAALNEEAEEKESRRTDEEAHVGIDPRPGREEPG
jgi:hypothetical protein